MVVPDNFEANTDDQTCSEVSGCVVGAITSYTETDPQVDLTTNGKICKGTGTQVTCTATSLADSEVNNDITISSTKSGSFSKYAITTPALSVLNEDTGSTGDSGDYYGIKAEVDVNTNPSINPTINQYAVHATGIAAVVASGTFNNYGVYANATSNTSGTTTNYGIYAAASGGDTNYAGYFDGTVVASTIDTGYGANELWDMNQHVKTDSAVTFATINTGYGANELYDMNQHVKTDSAVTFATIGVDSLTASGTVTAATLSGNLSCTNCVNATEVEDIYMFNTGDTMTGALTLSQDATDVINFSSNSTNDARGIAFNARTALSADYNDGWLRLNNRSEFSNGVYTPGNFRADGRIYVDNGTNYLSYPTGNYGSVQINGGGAGGYEGFSIRGDYVFMSDDSNLVGVYDDADNQWVWNREDNSQFRIYEPDSNSVALTIDTAGDVGIGDTSPSQKLEVGGNISVDYKVQARDTSGLQLATDEGTTRMTIKGSNTCIGTNTYNCNCSCAPAGSCNIPIDCASYNTTYCYYDFGCNCIIMSFLGHTKIKTKRGELPITEVKKGDFVEAYSLETKKKVWTEVEAIMDGEAKDYYIVTLEDGTELNITGCHPLYVKIDDENWDWITVKQIKKGMEVLNAELEPIKIKEAKYIYIEEGINIYDLETKEENLFAENILCHNAEKGCTGGTCSATPKACSTWNGNSTTCKAAGCTWAPEGSIGIGTTTPAAALVVERNVTGNANLSSTTVADDGESVAVFRNTHGDAGASGATILKLHYSTDMGDDYADHFINAAAGTDNKYVVSVAGIDYDDGAGTFTGMHPVVVKGPLKEGMLVKTTGKLTRLNPDGPGNWLAPEVTMTTKENEKAVYGIIVSLVPEGIILTHPDDPHRDVYLAIGIGDNDVGRSIKVLIDNTGGIPKSGDLLTSSNNPGYLKVQNDDIIHSYTVGKVVGSLEENDFNKYGKIKAWSQYKAMIVLYPG